MFLPHRAHVHPGTKGPYLLIIPLECKLSEVIPAVIQLQGQMGKRTTGQHPGSRSSLEALGDGGAYVPQVSTRQLGVSCPAQGRSSPGHPMPSDLVPRVGGKYLWSRWRPVSNVTQPHPSRQTKLAHSSYLDVLLTLSCRKGWPRGGIQEPAGPRSVPRGQVGFIRDPRWRWTHRALKYEQTGNFPFQAPHTHSSFHLFMVINLYEKLMKILCPFAPKYI